MNLQDNAHMPQIHVRKVRYRFDFLVVEPVSYKRIVVEDFRKYEVSNAHRWDVEKLQVRVIRLYIDHRGSSILVTRLDAVQRSAEMVASDWEDLLYLHPSPIPERRKRKFFQM